MKKDRKTTPLIAANSASKNNHNHKHTSAKIKSLTLDRITEGIVALDKELTYSYVNKCAGKLLGRKPKELIGEKLVDFGSEQPPFAAACQRALETQTIVPFHGYFAPTDAWLEGRVYPSEDGVSVLFTSEVWAGERGSENRQREDRYGILFDTMQEGFLLAEVINGHDRQPVDYRILEANASMARFLGKPREDLIGRTAGELFTLDEHDLRILKRAGEVAMGGEPFFVEAYANAANRWFRMHVFSPRQGQFANLLSDVTEFKRTELALGKSEEKFSKAFHLSPSAMAITDSKESRIVDVNQSLLNLFKLEREDILGHTVQELGITANPDDSAALARLVQEQGSVHDYELVIQARDGEHYYLLISIEEIEFEGTAHSLISAVDITERKRTEAKLLDISKFPAENPNPVMRFTPGGELLYANQAAAPLLAFWHAKHGQTIPADLLELLASFTLSSGDIEIELEGDGKIFSCLLVPIRDMGYVNLYLRDITERKQAEESLRGLINQTTAGITRMDMDGRISFVNQTFCEMLGYPESEVIGKTIWEISSPDDVSKSRRLFDRMCVEGESYQLEKRLIRKNGSVLWVTAGTSPLRDANGRIHSAVSILTDITRRKRAEQSLLETARRTLYLSSLSDTIRHLSRPFQIETEATHALGVHLKASRVAYAEVVAPGTLLIRQAYVNGVENNIGEFQVSDFVPAELLSKFHQGRAVMVTDLPHDAAAARSQLVVPLVKDEQLIAAMIVQQSEPRSWSSDEISVAEETAERMQAAMDRALTEGKLRESEERFRILSNTVPSMVWATAADGTVLYLNDHWYQYTGLSPDESISNWAELSLHPDDAEAYVASWKHALAAVPDEYVQEVRYRRYDGEYRWFQSRAVPARDESGSVTAWYGVSTDVHDRVQKQDELQQLINQTPFMLTRCSRDLRYRFVSRAYAEMLGRRPEDVAGRPIVDVMGEAGLKIITPYVERVLQGERVEYEDKVPFAGVGTPWLHVVYMADRDAQGNVIGWFASITDITARKEAEQKLRARAEEIQAVLNVSPVGIFVASDPECIHITANPAGYELVQIPAQQGVNISKSAPAAERPSYRVFRDGVELPAEQLPMQMAARLGMEVEAEILELRFDNGARKSLYTYARPLFDERGKTRGAVAAMLDITERVHMEDSLRQARKQAEETADRMTRLQEMTASLAGAVAPAQLAELIIEQVTRSTGAAAGRLVEVVNDGKDVKTIAALGYPPETVHTDPVPLSAPTPMSDCIRTRQAIWIESLEEFALQYPSLAESRRSFGNEATVALPLLVGDRVLGGLEFSFPEKHEFLLEERGFLLAVAVQCAQGLERARAEASLHESEERYRAIVSQATAGIVRKDALGRLLFVNDAFCRMLGYDRSELTGKMMWELTHEQDVQENQRLFNRLMVEGASFQLEKRLIRRDSSILWATVSVSPVLDTSGRPQSAVSVYADITERKQAEERLTLLAAISELTRSLEDPDELMSAVARAVGEHLHVKRCLFNEIDLEHDIEIVHRDYHNGIESVEGVHKITDYSSITTAEMIAGKTVVNHDSKSDPRTAGDYDRSYVPNGERAYVAVPLMRDDHWVASLWVSTDTPRRWSTNEVSLLETIAERAWTATEKLRIHAALRDSEERLRVMFNTTAVGFATLALDTRFLQVNDAFCSIVGYSREQLLALDYDSLTHPDYLESTRNHIAQLIAGEIPSFVLEKLYLRGDGTPIWVQNSVSLLRDSDSNPLNLITICQDVTERRNAEDQLHKLNLELEGRVQRRTAELQSANEFLRESESTSRLILESVPDAIVIANPEGVVVHCNTQVETLFGYSPNELLGQPVGILFPERYHQYLIHPQNFGENPTRRMVGVDRQLFALRRNGDEFPVEVSLSPISNNTTWDMIVTIRDDTEQRKAQEALRVSEEKLRTLFEILPVGISFLNKNAQIIEMNSALTQILALSKQELLQGAFKARDYIRSDGSIMPPSEFASIRALKEQKTIYNVETGIIKANGETIWTSVNAAPVKVADVEAVVVTVDITERKNAENALHKNRERLRALSRRLVEVQEDERRAIARELHDRVGQNLAALNLNLNILRSQLSVDALEKVGSRLTDSVQLVNDILMITRSVMADLRSNVLDDYGLESALREYADQFTQRFGVQVIADKTSRPIPRFDPSIEMTLLRIAQEALTNVAHHSQASQATITLSMEGNTVKMTIQDNGVGILSWQKANQKGSHGLRIIRERTEAFGGSMQIQSAYKKGTTIEVKIPVENSNQTRVSREKRS